MTSHPTDPPHSDTAPTGRTPPAWRRLPLTLAPVLFMLIVALTDLLTPDWLHVSPVMAAVPVLAAALLPCGRRLPLPAPPSP
ncbi:hypothetical protein O1M54_48190 [Streptomyces diastatochromogenes]|nr:hypothetical protein [Streptomyces diastatochromogenes]